MEEKSMTEGVNGIKNFIVARFAEFKISRRQ